MFHIKNDLLYLGLTFKLQKGYLCLIHWGFGRRYVYKVWGHLPLRLRLAIRKTY